MGAHLQFGRDYNPGMKSDDPKCIIRHVSMNQEKSFYFKYGDWFVYLGMILLAFVFIFKLLKLSKVRTPK